MHMGPAFIELEGALARITQAEADMHGRGLVLAVVYWGRAQDGVLNSMAQSVEESIMFMMMMIVVSHLICVGCSNP